MTSALLHISLLPLVQHYYRDVNVGSQMYIPKTDSPHRLPRKVLEMGEYTGQNAMKTVFRMFRMVVLTRYLVQSWGVEQFFVFVKNLL
jgi:hypothetical protein